MLKVPRLIFGDFILNLAFGKLPSVMICSVISGVHSLSTQVQLTFILPKLYLKKSTKNQLNFSNS